MIMIGFNAFATALMMTVINVALPQIAAELSIDAVTLNWVPMVFLIAGAVLVLPFSQLADMHGRKRIFLWGCAGVMLSSSLSALASTVEALIFFRILQGMSAATHYVTVLSIASSALPANKRGRTFSMIAATMYLGFAAGPLAGGLMIEYLSWRWALVVHLPFMLVAIYIGIAHVPQEWRVDRRLEFDRAGALVYAVAIIALAVGIATLPNLSAWLLTVVGVVGLYGFAKIEARMRYPLFDVLLMQANRAFRYSCGAALFMYAATFSNLVLISLYLQYLKGMSAKAAGMAIMAQPFAMASFAPLVGYLVDRFEPRTIASVGVGLTFMSLLSFAAMEADTPIHWIVLTLAMSGVGLSLFAPTNAIALVGSVANDKYGTASGAHASVRIVGQMFSMAIVTLVFAYVMGPLALTPAHYPALAESIKISFILTAILCLPSFYLSLTRGRILH